MALQTWIKTELVSTASTRQSSKEDQVFNGSPVVGLVQVMEASTIDELSKVLPFTEGRRDWRGGRDIVNHLGLNYYSYWHGVWLQQWGLFGCSKVRNYTFNSMSLRSQSKKEE